MLNLILAESAIERIPEPLWNHPSVSKRANKLNKRPGQMLLDRSLHHRAMLKLENSKKRGRPDIVHFSLLEAFGAPLNRENLLRTYVVTLDNYIICFHPKIRLPKNYDRFKGLIEQLYELGKIVKHGKTLMELRKGTLQNLIQKIKSSYTIAFTRKGKPQLLHLAMSTLAAKERPTVIVGAFPSGHFTDEVKTVSKELVSIDPETLAAWTVISRMTYEYEKVIGLTYKRMDRI
jgi:rRNA small subunit pseudouridine methyltransferase Nep1